MSKTKRTGHGGGPEAKTTGTNRKNEKRYVTRALDFARTIGALKDPTGYHKPGSRKKVGG